jgi:predicted peptidase
MKSLLVLALGVLFAAFVQLPPARYQQRTFQAPDGTTLLYGLAVPSDYDPSRPRPLVLALHPGGGGTPYYGAQFMRQLFLPGLRALNPIMVAPDSPTRSWSDPVSEQAVMALLNNVIGEYAIDHDRTLVIGYSNGGRGTWFMSSRHADLFTAAIVMAGMTDEPIDRLAKIPTYIIHSRDDEVVPFAQAEQRAASLEKMGRTVKFEALQGLGHYDMGSYAPAIQHAGGWVAEHWKK